MEGSVGVDTRSKKILTEIGVVDRDRIDAECRRESLCVGKVRMCEWKGVDGCTWLVTRKSRLGLKMHLPSWQRSFRHSSDQWAVGWKGFGRVEGWRRQVGGQQLVKMPLGLQ